MSETKIIGENEAHISCHIHVVSSSLLVVVLINITEEKQ
jgi:hypothetical protein